jgi:hypothetical protein
MRSMAKRRGGRACGILVVALLVAPGMLSAQTDPQLERGLQVDRLEAEPASMTLVRGESSPLQIRALDTEGRELDVILRVTGPRSAVRVADGEVTALAVGDHVVTAVVVLPPDAQRDPPSLRIPVRVEWPAVEAVEVMADPGRLYAGTALKHRALARLGDESLRPDSRFQWSSSDPEVASVDDYGNVTAHAPGTVEIAAETEGVRGSVRHEIEAFPAQRLEISADVGEVLTGDVVRVRARALDAAGREVADAPVTWGFNWEAGGRDILAPGAPATLQGGAFTAEVPGEYTIFALSGPLSHRLTFQVDERDVVREVRLLGQGRVADQHTSDFWIWEGVDGRDWALTGTWGADGWTFLWDVTDPERILKADSVRVDARTVNDVKVSPDGRYATLTREGASDRRNGLVILDLSTPGRLSIASIIDEGLTGGVHNAYPTDEYVYALSGGEKYLIIDMSDIRAPRTVGEVQHGDCRIHDVWVHDGIAYSAQWGCGLLVHDVGNGRWGGTPERPVFVSQFLTPGGRTHAVYPYYQEETGIFYIYLGDEIIGRTGMAWAGPPTGPYTPGDDQERVPEHTAGYVHIVDFSDPESPRKVARYHVPEYGTHNIWVEDDVLYQAYYEGGLRVVDVSGELRGNLADQGREMAVFKPFDPYGHIRNAPQVWSAMPFKGRIFLSDHNSGLWSVELQPPETRPVS